MRLLWAGGVGKEPGTEGREGVRNDAGGRARDLIHYFAGLTWPRQAGIPVKLSSAGSMGAPVGRGVRGPLGTSNRSTCPGQQVSTT